MTDLSGQVAVVTGGGSGIGRAIAIALGTHGAAVWLVGFTGGDDGDLASLEAALGPAGEDEGWLERHVELAVDRSRVALAHRGDWVAPMAAVRHQLGDEPSELMWRFAAQPAFRTMLVLGAIGVTAFWVFELIR